MKNLFNLENPFLQFLTKVGDMILANFLFLLCCMPVVTVGAAMTALHKVTQDIATDSESGLLRTFFRAFRENFKQATTAWLVMLVFFVGMGCNLLLVVTYLNGVPAIICNVFIGIAIALMVLVSTYLYPLMVRYDNTLKEHVLNSSILAIVKLPRTLLMVFVNLLPLFIAYFSMQTLFSTLVFWLTIGFAFSSYISSTLLLPVFREMETNGGQNMQIMT